MAIVIAEVYKKEAFYPQKRIRHRKQNQDGRCPAQVRPAWFAQTKAMCDHSRCPHTFGNKGNVLGSSCGNASRPQPQIAQNTDPCSRLLPGAVASAPGARAFLPLSPSAPEVPRWSLETTGGGKGGMAEGPSLQELMPTLCQNKIKWPFLNKTMTPQQWRAS